MKPFGPPQVVALVSAGSAVVLAVLVLTGISEPLDQRARDLFWPGERLGTAQARANTTTNYLSSAHLATGGVAVAALISAWRRRAAPFLFALGVTVLAAVLVIATKWLMGELPIAQSVDHDVAAFPSGHMVAAIVFTGQLVLLARKPTGVVLWLPTVALAALMAIVIQMAALHHLTDVLGGVLIGVAILASTGTWRLRRSALTD